MSKLGKKPILVPKDTKIKVEGSKLVFTGPKGTRELSINDKIFTVTLGNDNILHIKENNKDDTTSILWGTTRSIINNAIIGVSKGHEKILELTGVGFRSNLKGNVLNLQIGYSHDVSYKIPEGIKVLVEKNTTIKISGIDKEMVGKVSSEIRQLKPVEPYKGKGIKERGQYVLKKEGKKK